LLKLYLTFLALYKRFYFWVPDSRCRDFRDDSALTCHPGRPSGARSIRDPKANPNLFYSWVPNSRCRDFRDDNILLLSQFFLCICHPYFLICHLETSSLFILSSRKLRVFPAVIPEGRAEQGLSGIQKPIPIFFASGSRILFDSLRSLTVPERQCFNMSSRAETRDPRSDLHGAYPRGNLEGVQSDPRRLPSTTALAGRSIPSLRPAERDARGAQSAPFERRGMMRPSEAGERRPRLAVSSLHFFDKTKKWGRGFPGAGSPPG